MQLNPNLFFNGNAEEALEHYQGALGGDLEIVRFKDTPGADSAPPEWAVKLAYGTLRSPLGVVNVMDAPPDRAGKPGSNFAIGVQAESEAQTDAIFSKLSHGGTVTMALEKTFWAARFGMCIDKFGISWMVSHM